MKLVREHINEKFSDDTDILKDMNIGTKNLIMKDLAHIGILEQDIILNNDYSFFMKEGRRREPSPFFEVQMKYFPEAKKKFMMNMKEGNESFYEALNEATKEEISIEDIDFMVNYFFPDKNNDPSKPYFAQLDFYKKKLARTKQQKKEDKENNIYVFIGDEEKVPVTVNGKKYYEDKFQVEKMVKLDKYNYSDLRSVEMMKMRAHMTHKGAVYMLTVPKDVMDEKYYDEIPEEWRYIVDKYKKRI
jgi:hypothetical protein